MLRDSGLVPLSHDHQHALALCVVTGRALAADGSESTVTESARHIVEKFDTEIREHFEFEEEVLFPALSGMASVGALVAELKSEHGRMRAMVEALRSGSDGAVVVEFCEMLRQHIHKEERVLFEEAQRLLTRAQLDEIGRRRSGARRPE